MVRKIKLHNKKKTMASLVTILPVGLGVVVFVLSLLLLKSYLEVKRTLKLNDRAPTVPLPLWSKSGDSGAVVMSGADALNKYWVQTSGGATQTLTFPPAADTVDAAPTAIVGNTYSMVINNNSGHTITSFVAGTGNTLHSFPSTLLTGHYIIIKLELTDVRSGHEAVSYTYLSTGTN